MSLRSLLLSLLAVSTLAVAEPPPCASPLHYRPALGSVADTVPFFWKGQYHVIYLRAGFKQVPWEHIVSTDLVHWSELPSALLPDGDPDGPAGQDIGTGSVIEHDGTFHIFCTGINPRNPRGEQCIMHATSSDLISWTWRPADTFYADDVTYKNAGFRDAYVFWNDQARAFWMILCAVDAKTGRWTQGVAESHDLVSWKQIQPLNYDPAPTVACECPDLFKIGDTWYMLQSVWYPKQATGTTDVRYSKDIRGPYRLSPTHAIDTPLLYAAKRMFDGKRHVLTGWIRDLGGARDDGAPQFGGDQCIPREVYPGPAGQLYFRPVAEAVAQFNRSLLDSSTDSALTALSTPIATPADYLLQCDVRIHPGADFTLAMRQAGDASGYRIVIRSAKNEAEISSSKFSHPRHVAIDFTKPIKIQAFVQGSIIECFIHDAYAFSCRAYGPRAGAVQMSVANGQAQVIDLTVKSRETSSGPPLSSD
jgi:sucrose-6-phosphate hydrolase SacC (GH32 family)